MALASSDNLEAVVQETSDEAVEQKTLSDSCGLHDLTPSTCGIGIWTLRVVEPRVVEYTYNWQGQERRGRKLERILLSENSDPYCMGTVKRTGTADTAVQKFPKHYVENVMHHAGLRETPIHRVASEACHRLGDNQGQFGAAEHDLPQDSYTA